MGSCNFFCCNCDGGCIKSTLKQVATGTDPTTLTFTRFRAIDRNNKGWIDLEDTKAYAHIRAGDAISEAKAKAAFAKIDVNGDGRIDFKEFD